MEIKKIVKYCRDCAFLGNAGILECKHPYYEDKGPYSNLIINRDDLEAKTAPEKCPLRTENLKITYSLIDEKINY